MWTKDVSQAPKIIYTAPANHDSLPHVTRIIYDPQAESGKRWVYECAFLVSEDETVPEIEARIGL